MAQIQQVQCPLTGGEKDRGHPCLWGRERPREEPARPQTQALCHRDVRGEGGGLGRVWGLRSGSCADSCERHREERPLLSLLVYSFTLHTAGTFTPLSNWDSMTTIALGEWGPSTQLEAGRGPCAGTAVNEDRTCFGLENHVHQQLSGHYRAAAMSRRGSGQRSPVEGRASPGTQTTHWAHGQGHGVSSAGHACSRCR